MPRGDGTGPMGTGPMTGRAAGYCAGSPTPGFANPAPRMGMGFRRGAGFYGRGGGFGRGFGSFGRGVGFGRGGGFGRGFGSYGRGRGFGYFGRGVGFRGRVAPFAPRTYRAPVYPNYGYQYQYPAYQARPAYGIW